MSESWIKEKQTKAIAAAKRDPVKAGVLGVLTVAMLVVAKIQFGGPSKASAATSEKSAAASSASAKLSDARQSNVNLRGDSSVVAWLGQPIKTLDRNLFEFRPEFFPRTVDVGVSTARVVEEELFWDQLAKSMSAQADSKKQKQIRIDNLQAAASKLRVQSTIMGTQPRAMVDGRMTQVGGTVEADTGGTSIAFKVLKVDARRIVIERDGIQIEVPMGTGRVRVLNLDE